MPTLKQIRENAEEFFQGLTKRGMDTDIIKKLLEIDKRWRKEKAELDLLRAKKNEFSKMIAQAKSKGEIIEKELELMKKNSEEITQLEREIRTIESKIEEILLLIPNMPHNSVPLGNSSEENVVVREGPQKPKKDSKSVVPHYDLLTKHRLIDFERGAKLAGHRFAFLRGKIARLERALSNFMVECAVGRGYTEYWVPYLVGKKAMIGSGHLPKFSKEVYKCSEDELYLIPTAEVPLVNLFADEILDEEDLPVKICAFSPCFRREAGEYQKDIKGFIRQHQFDKVELVKFCLPDESYKELESMVKDAESVLQRLGLPYRVVELCTGDLGFASAKTYDLEVWIPSQDKYREVSSCSNCTDFQSIRANIKFWRKGKPEYVHTLNGSGIAVGRTLVALVENFQDEDGIDIPKPLQDFMQCERIEWE